jgi:hypothetical protein
MLGHFEVSAGPYVNIRTKLRKAHNHSTDTDLLSLCVCVGGGGFYIYIVTCIVTVDGYWIDNWIYWTLTLKYNWVSPDSLSFTTHNWVSHSNSANTVTTLLASLANTILVTAELMASLAIHPETELGSQSHVTTDGQSVSQSWCRAPSGAHDQMLLTVRQSGALSDERSGLSFVIVFVSLLSIVNRWYIYNY